MDGDIDQLAQSEAAELADAMAGYNKEARGTMPPATESDTDNDGNNVETKNEIEVKTEEPPNVVDLAEELKQLKAKVAASTSDPDTVRKMHGEIGNINRTLKQMQKSSETQKDNDPDEFATALSDAEKIAEEFPEIAAPLVKAIKALKSNESKDVDIDDRVSSVVSKIRERDAIEMLAEEHPDFETVRDTKEFKEWESTKTPEFQNRLRTTWNPAVVSRALTEFKDTLKARQKKQEKLAAAVVAPSSAAQSKSSVLSDEEGLFVGYNKGHKRLNKR